MPKFKKNTSAFRMSGYSYAGTSPVKSDTKLAPSGTQERVQQYKDLGWAQDHTTTGHKNYKAPAEDVGAETNKADLNKGITGPTIGGVGQTKFKDLSNLRVRANLNSNIAAINSSSDKGGKSKFWKKTGKFMGDLGKQVLKHGLEAGVKAGVAAAFATPPKRQRQEGGKFTGNIGSTSKLVG